MILKYKHPIGLQNMKLGWVWLAVLVSCSVVLFGQGGEKIRIPDRLKEHSLPEVTEYNESGPVIRPAPEHWLLIESHANSVTKTLGATPLPFTFGEYDEGQDIKIVSTGMMSPTPLPISESTAVILAQVKSTTCAFTSDYSGILTYWVLSPIKVYKNNTETVFTEFKDLVAYRPGGGLKAPNGRQFSVLAFENWGFLKSGQVYLLFLNNQHPYIRSEPIIQIPLVYRAFLVEGLKVFPIDGISEAEEFTEIPLTTLEAQLEGGNR